MKYYDISPLIHSKLAVWPGDQCFERQVVMDFAKGDNLVLSTIKSTVHLGAHVDAPSHYHPKGASIEQRDLNFYFGRAQVLRVSVAKGERIMPQHLKGLQITEKRVLFNTGSYPQPNHWNEDFNSLSSEVIEYLKQAGVILVGIDTPSIDPFDSKALEAHNAIYKADMAVLEGIVLKDVPEGSYFLSALPLPIVGGDASPVRAVLFDQNTLG